MIGAAAVFGALILKGTDLAKYIVNLFNPDNRSDAINGVLTLVITAVVGVILTVVMAQTQWADEITIGDETLATLGGGSLVVLGLTVSSFGAVLYDFKKAIDGSENSGTPAVTPAAEERRQQQVEAYFAQKE